MNRGLRWIGKEIAIGLAAPVTNAAADGFAIASNGWIAADQARRGARGLSRSAADLRAVRTARPREASVIVGGELWHGGDDRRNAIASIGLDFLAFHTDVIKNASSDVCREWIADDVAPVLAEWQNFVARMAASTLAAYVTEWSVFETWFDRLVRLRQAAKAKGIHLDSPEPTPLPQTVWQRGANGTGSSLDVWIAGGKTVVFGAIAITGIAAFYSIIRDVHGLYKRRRS